MNKISSWLNFSHELILIYFTNKKCRGTGSDCRLHDFQSCALPTELPRLIKWRGRRDLNPRSPAWQAGALNRYATPSFKSFYMGETGFEPMTPYMWSRCSNHWAIRPINKLSLICFFRCLASTGHIIHA